MTLLPCPFCGIRRNAFARTKRVATPQLLKTGDGHCVRCDYCWARGPTTPAADDAIDQWNEPIHAARIGAERRRQP